MTGTVRRVYVHIGPPKTGTTYLQAALQLNERALAERDVELPLGNIGGHFLAACDLRGLNFKGHENPKTVGAWPRLVTAVGNGSASRAVISHEVLCGAKPEHIQRLFDDLSPAEVHVIYGARDIARQLPAGYQESVKNRGTREYGDHVKRAMRQLRQGDVERGFWRSQNASGVLSRWGRFIPAERIHVLTLPAAGGAPTELWRRFCTIVAVDPTEFDLNVGRSNPSLSAEETEVLRLVNLALPDQDEFPWPKYARRVKRRFKAQAEAGGSGTRLTVPYRFRAELVAHTAQVKEDLRAAGYDIAGTLDDLDPTDAAFGPPLDLPPSAVSDAAARILADVLTSNPRGRQPGRER